MTSQIGAEVNSEDITKLSMSSCQVSFEKSLKDLQLQWGLEYQTSNFRTHSKSECFEAQMSNAFYLLQDD